MKTFYSPKNATPVAPGPACAPKAGETFTIMISFSLTSKVVSKVLFCYLAKPNIFSFFHKILLFSPLCFQIICAKTPFYSVVMSKKNLHLNV